MLSFWLKKTWHNIRNNLGPQLGCLLTITLALGTFGMFILLGINFVQEVKQWQRKIPIIVFFNTAEQAQLAKEKIEKRNQISHVNYVSPKQSLLRLKKWLKDKEILLEGIDDNTLLPSLEIGLKTEFYNLNFLTTFAHSLKKMPGVVEVVYPSQLFLLAVKGWKFFQILLFLIGIFLSIATIFIVSNFVYLHFQKKKEEIAIMRLLGATEGFIRMPFFIEGILQGFIASLLSVFILWLFAHWFNRQIAEASLHFKLSFLNLKQTLGFIVFGSILGYLGSFLGTKK